MVSLEVLINNLTEAIFLFDRIGRLVFTNKAGEEFLGRSYKEIKYKHFNALFSGAKEVVMLVHKTITEGRSFNCKEMEVDIGRSANVDVYTTPFYKDYNGSGITGNEKFDSSNEKNLATYHLSQSFVSGAILCIRENLLLTEREDYQFDSLLYLLGSIAHEIKNPLSGIKGAAQILMTKFAHSSLLIAQNKSNKTMSHELSAMSYLEAEECVDLILKETDRLNSVLHSYLTMTRRPVFNSLNIHEVVEYALKVMKTSIEEKQICINKSYDPSLPDIIGDESKLLQVFINLLKNAVEAMKTSKNRTLTISTKLSNEYMVTYKDINESGETTNKLKGKDTSLATRNSLLSLKQRWVVVEIKDTGKGISKDEIDKIFLPFYTKKTGGSGLGLALSKKIIKDHGGIIKVKSKIGAGAAFSIYLPMLSSQKSVALERERLKTNG